MTKHTQPGAKARQHNQKRQREVSKLITKLLRLLMEHYGGEPGYIGELFKQIRDVNESVEIMARGIKHLTDGKRRDAPGSKS